MGPGALGESDSQQDVTARQLVSALGQLEILRARLRGKHTSVDKLKTLCQQLLAELASTRMLLKSSVDARTKDMQRFKAAADSYRASQRLSASYETDLEQRIKALSNQERDLRSSHDQLQREYADLRSQHQISQDALAQAKHGLQTSCQTCKFRPEDVGFDSNSSVQCVLTIPIQGDHFLTDSDKTCRSEPPTYSPQSASELKRDNNTSISSDRLDPVVSDTLEAYSERQDVSFSYETFLLEVHEEDRAEIEALRKSNESLVADFADLLASYKQVVQELLSAQAALST